MIAYSSHIFDSVKCRALAKRLCKKPKSIIIFGLPFSGKTTLANAIQKQDASRTVLDEWFTSKETKRIQTEKRLAITSQYLTAIKENSEFEMKRFMKTNGLNPRDFVIVLIRQN